MQQRLRSEGIVLVPALPAVALFIYWAAHEGGYLPTTWMPSALVVLGLLAATLIGLGLAGVRLARPAAIALGALVAFTAWSYLSITWAASPGDALEGSNRTLLYLLLFGLFLVLPWRAWTAYTVLSAFALGIGALALATLVQIGAGDDVTRFFTDSRLVSPIDYVNGSAALFMTAAVLGTALASRRELPVPLRGVLIALATAALQTSVLCASRGWLFSLPVVVVLVLLLVPGRVRLALWAIPPLLGTLLVLPRLLDVFERADAARSAVEYRRLLADAAGSAVDLALPICLVVLVAGTVVALLDRRTPVPARVAAGANRVAAAVAVLAVLAGVVAGFAATDGRPDQAIADYWDRSTGYKDAEAGASRFAQVGSGRPDFWRVSLDAFEAHPLTGLGQDNWGDYYLRERDTDEQPRWTHSIEMRLLAHTGAIGFLLFAAFLAAATVSAVRGRRRAGPAVAGAAAIALVPVVVWLVHGSIDWFWELPALSGPAFAFLGLAAAMIGNRARHEDAGDVTAKADASGTLAAPGADAEPAVTADPAPPRTRGRLVPALLAGATAGVILLAALVLALPWLAERETVDAAGDWQREPVEALRQLDRAAELNPLSGRPDLTAGVIALELGSDRIAEARFGRAVERDRDDWFAHFGRGLAESAAGRRAAARADFEAAHALSPGEPLVDDAIARVDGRRPLTSDEAFGQLRENVARLSGQP